MTLLRLSPESDRLRRIAKAHAAGELSTPDYRRIRAQVIERFGAATFSDGDDTQPRTAPRASRASEASATDAIEQEATPLQGSRRRLSAWWFVLIGLALAALAGLAAA